ncbi:response regulator [Lewinella sp. 4G2]|uniref:response regulator n=1 Tax=Lewinella sp. 4G2 TaxID=1803372 RepID=UPI0007B4B2B1|nr:response regulator [Lewinella sp. 4G2]OAV42941.1 hypothetical protein A3850_017110 [Lewinella sp. 4G2]
MPGAQLLIVEDDPIIAADLGDRAVELGYEVLALLRHGEAALKFVRSGQVPDLILMDIQLAGAMDGITAAIQLYEEFPQLPLIFLTANTDTATFSSARQARPRAFLSKPIRTNDLVYAIELALDEGLRPNALPLANDPAPAAAPSTDPDGLADPSADERDSAEDLASKNIISLRSGNRLLRLDLGQVRYVKANDYYCQAVMKTGDTMLTMTLKAFLSFLPQNHSFMRVHRSYLINLHHLKEVAQHTVIIAGEEIPVSRNKRKELLERLKEL